MENYKEIHDVFELPQIEFKKIYLDSKIVLGDCKAKVFKIMEDALSDLNSLSLGSQTMISCYLCQILIILSRLTIGNMSIKMEKGSNSLLPRAVREAIFYIHANYMKPIALKELCSEIRVSPQYLIRVFGSSLEKTPIQYINLFRISRAQDLLKHTNLSVKEIAYEVGFENPYYFCRMFKKITKTTPSIFRNTN